MRSNFDTSTKIASILLQNQLDNLGIDYIDKRNGLIDAVTHRGRPPRRQAAGRGRHAGHGGRPAEGFVLEGTGRLSNVLLFPARLGKG